MFHYSALLIGILCIFSQTSADSCNVKSLFDTTCPLGDLTVEIKTPEVEINLSKDNCDKFYNKEDFSKEPIVKFASAKSDTLYTLLMADPDAVNLKQDTYVLHWLAANIKGSDFVDGNLKNALIIKDYHPPSPPLNSGIHRYQFTVFTQENKLFGKVDHVKRANFLLETWLESTGQSLCGPVAGLQFRVKAGTSKPV